MEGRGGSGVCKPTRPLCSGSGGDRKQKADLNENYLSKDFGGNKDIGLENSDAMCLIS